MDSPSLSGSDRHFVTLNIYELSIQAGKDKRYQINISFKDKQYSVECQDKQQTFNWKRLRFAFPVLADELQTAQVKFELIEKGGKMLGGDRKLGETHVPVSVLLRRHARYDKDSASVTPENILIFNSKEKDAAKASVDVWSEAYGWQHALTLLKSDDTRHQILIDLERLTTRPNKKDLRQSLTDAGDTKIAVYMTEEFFAEIMNVLHEAITKPSVTWRPQMFDLFKGICNEARTRQKLIDLGVLTYFRRYLRTEIATSGKKSSKKLNKEPVSPRSVAPEDSNDVQVKVLMLTCIKAFFSSAKGQRSIVKEKILDVLILKLSPTTPTKVLLMVCEVLRYFDASHIEQMMERDILSALNSIAICESFSVQLEFLEMVKFFGLGYKDALEEEKVSKMVRKLTSSPDTHVKLKAIDVVEKFKFKQADSTENVQSLIGSFDPDGNPLTKMKILDKLSADLKRDEDYEKVVVEKTTVLQLLARCLNDVSTVIRDKADDIILGLKTASRKQLADAGILQVWKTMLLNRKLQQEYQDTTLARLVPYFGEVAKEVEEVGLIAVVAAIIGDSSFSNKARLLAVDVVEKLNDDLFFSSIVEPGTFAKMLEWAKGPWSDTTEQYRLLGRCAMWGKRCLEIAQRAGPCKNALAEIPPPKVDASLSEVLAEDTVSTTDQHINEYATLLLPILRAAQQQCTAHEIRSASANQPFFAGYMSMLSMFKECRATVANLICLVQAALKEGYDNASALTFKEMNGPSLFNELLTMHGENPHMTNYIIMTLVEVGQKRPVLGDTVSAVLGDEVCIALLQQTVPKDAEAALSASSVKVLAWLVLWKSLLHEVKLANVFLDLGGLGALSGILRHSSFGAHIRTPAGEVLSIILKNDDMLQRVLPDKGLYKSLVDYLDLVQPLSSAPIMRLIRQLMVDEENMKYLCQDPQYISKVLLKLGQVQWDHGEAAREVRNTGLAILAYWSVKGTNLSAIRERNEFVSYLSQILDYQATEPENFDVACAITERAFATAHAGRETNWNTYFGYRYENATNSIASADRPPTIGWLLLSRAARTMTRATHRPGQSGTVNHYANALQNLCPSLPKVNFVEACKKRTELKKSKLSLQAPDNTAASPAAAGDGKTSSEPADTPKPSKKKDKGKEKMHDDEPLDPPAQPIPSPVNGKERTDEGEPIEPPESPSRANDDFRAPSSPDQAVSAVVEAEETGLSSTRAEIFYHKRPPPIRALRPEKKEFKKSLKARPRRSSSSSSTSSAGDWSPAESLSDSDSDPSFDLRTSMPIPRPPPLPAVGAHPYRRRSISASSSGSASGSENMDDDLRQLLRQLDGDQAPSSSSIDALVAKGSPKIPVSPVTQKVMAAVRVSNPKRFLDVLDEKIYETVWPGALLEPELFAQYPVMTVGEYLEESVFLCVDTLAEIDFKIMSSYSYSSVLTWLTRCDTMHTSGEFEPAPRIRSAMCSLIGKLYNSMTQRDRSIVGPYGSTLCVGILSHSDEPAELVAAVQAAGVLKESATVEDFVSKPVFEEILNSSFATAKDSPEQAVALCDFISSVSLLAPTKTKSFSTKAVKLVLSAFPSEAKAVTAAMTLLEAVQGSAASDVQDPEFLKLLLGVLAKNSGVAALDKLGLAVLRGLASSKSGVGSLDDELFSDLLRGLWRRIAPGGSSEVMREASGLIVRLVSKNRKRAIPIIKTFDFWADLSALYSGAQHIYLIPILAAMCRASSSWSADFLNDVVARLDKIPPADFPLFFRVLVVLFGAMRADSAPDATVLAKLVGAVSSSSGNGNLAIGTALDVMEWAYLVADQVDQTHVHWALLQAKLAQVMATWNFHQYSFYFTLFQQKISPAAAIPTWKAPRTTNHLEETTRHILLDRDCLTFGCNQPSLESVIGNTPVTTGCLYFSVSTRILPSWCTIQAGFITKSAWKKLDPENFVGCGNVEGSYGYDPLNLRVYNNGNIIPTPNAAKFYQGHVIWCFFDVANRTISFKTPTSDHPNVIKDVDLSEPLYPCVSIDSDANCVVKFDVGPMTYGPNNYLYLPI